MNAETHYQTKVSHSDIHSLQVKVLGEIISEPYIELNNEKQIEISFDDLGDGYTGYSYSIIHCDADWKKSQLMVSEYMTGFQEVLIEDYASSIATTTPYINYRITLPNDEVQLTKSGNYAVLVHKQGEYTEPVLTACFSIVEPLIDISASISSNTDIDTNNEHQQLSFTLHTEQFPIAFPQNDLKISIKQNSRTDNEIDNVQPMNVQANKIVYSHKKELIFKAGNEFRRMEFLSHRYKGLGIEEIHFVNPYYHVSVEQDASKKGKGYKYDQDQNGRFFIQCSGCNNPNIEADYHMVHFSLHINQPLAGEVYISGELFQNRLSSLNKMVYNNETKCYEKSVLLKQGNYNYQYLHCPPGSTRGETISIEGDYFQAENEYTILTFYRPAGARYDRLIGKKSLANHQLTF